MQKLKGERQVISIDDPLYPELLKEIPDPPEQLYVIGSLEGFKQGLAISGPRKPTSYGVSWAGLMAQSASLNGASIVTGGARGIDTASIRGVASLYAEFETLTKAVINGEYRKPKPQYVVLGGGCDVVYPSKNFDLFQKVIDQGGAIISEYEWEIEPQAWQFRARNRIIAGMCKALLIPEAGLPSGTFITADRALDYGREVWAIPGPIDSPQSKGTNKLIAEGATCIYDDNSFADAIHSVFQPKQA